MRIFHRLLLSSMAICTVLILPAQKNALHAYLPADAKAILQVNIPALASKMSWSELQQLSFFEEGLKEAPMEAKEFLKNPLSSGINFLGDLFIVARAGSKDGAATESYLYGTIADTAKFAAFLKNMMPGKKIVSSGNVRLLTDGKRGIAWTPQVFVIGMPSKKKAVPVGDKKTKNTKATATEKTAGLNHYKQLLAPAVKPVTTDERFMKLASEGGDIRFWINRNIEKPKTAGKKSDEMLKMMNMGILQQGNYMAGVVKFEKGKAVVELKNYMNSSMDSLYRLYPNPGLNHHLLNKLPGGQPVILWSFSLSPQMLTAMFKKMGMDKMIDSFSAKSKVKPMELIEGLNGDLTLAVIRANEFDEQDSVTAALGGIQVFLAASVKDKSKVQPLVSQLQKPKAEKPEDDAPRSKGPFGSMKPAMHLNDSLFVVSLSSIAAEKFLSSSGFNETSALVSSHTGHSSVFALDIGSILEFAMQMSKKGGQDEEMKKVKETFDRIVLFGGKYEDGALASTGELVFKNSEVNSLKQFMTLIEMAAEMEMKKKNRAVLDEPEEQ